MMEDTSPSMDGLGGKGVNQPKKWWSQPWKQIWLLSWKLWHSLLKLQRLMEWNRLHSATYLLLISNSTPSIRSPVFRLALSPVLYWIDMICQLRYRISKSKSKLEMSSGRVYLFGKRVGWSSISVSLTIDGGICTPTNGIHLPVSVVIVHHMEIAMPTSIRFWKYVRWNLS